MKQTKHRAALFDLDGVLFDTEPLYTDIWAAISKHYRPDFPNLEHVIKGKPLDEILQTYYPGGPEVHKAIVEWLDREEQRIPYLYIKGAHEFAQQLKARGIATAIVTSSNKKKMANVYRQHPELPSLFNHILTSEEFQHGKPAPDCYVKAARLLGMEPGECVVFEDSFNGLRSGRSAGATIVALSTTNPANEVAPYADMVIPHFELSGQESTSLWELF